MSVQVNRKNPTWLGRFTKLLESKSGVEIAVGFPQGKCQAYPDGRRVADVAARHVFGEGVPQRDFMSYASVGIQRRTQPILQQIAKETHPGAIAALQEAAGMEGAEAIKDSILNGPWEPNSEETIKLKGSSKPLIDTKHMTNSVTYVIRKKTS